MKFTKADDCEDYDCTECAAYYCMWNSNQHDEETED